MTVDIFALLADSPLLLLFTVIGFGYLLGNVSIAGIQGGPVVGVLLSVVALGYYLRVIVAMYIQPQPEDLQVLGDGDLEVKVFVAADAFTAAARTKIESAGGFVQLLAPEPAPAATEEAPAAETAEPATEASEAPAEEEEAPVEEAPAAEAETTDEQAAG